MTKHEAIELMRQGVKMTHKYFALEEWVYIGKDGNYVLEDGVESEPHEFWMNRKADYFNYDWEKWSKQPEDGI